jgi:DNA-binding CsgD family transcriptional regulator
MPDNYLAALKTPRERMEYVERHWSPRRREILRLVKDAKANTEIVRSLVDTKFGDGRDSESTVKRDIKWMARQVGVHPKRDPQIGLLIFFFEPDLVTEDRSQARWDLVWGDLTPRQRVIWVLLVANSTTGMIRRQIEVRRSVSPPASVSLVQKEIKVLLDRTGVHARLELVRWYLKNVPDPAAAKPPQNPANYDKNRG